MQAVYELATSRPFLPAKRTYTVAELEIYGHGYYEALAAALRVMKPAAKRWEGRMKANDRPHLVGSSNDNRNVDAPSVDPPDPWLRPLLIGIVVGTAIICLEVIVLLAARIAEAVR